jgi:hypothetical protein
MIIVMMTAMLNKRSIMLFPFAPLAPNALRISRDAPQSVCAVRCMLLLGVLVTT